MPPMVVRMLFVRMLSMVERGKVHSGLSGALFSRPVTAVMTARMAASCSSSEALGWIFDVASRTLIRL